MNVNLELNREEARFLFNQLRRHVETMQIELAHTEQHELQHGLAQDLSRMQRITGELERELQKAH